MILTASCGLEGMNKIVQYKPLLDKAIDLAEHKPQHCVVYQRPHLEANLIPGTSTIPPEGALLNASFVHCCLSGRDLDWEQALSQSSPVGAVELPGDHPLYILYTSGTTGRCNEFQRSRQMSHLLRCGHQGNPKELCATPQVAWWH